MRRSGLVNGLVLLAVLFTAVGVSVQAQSGQATPTPEVFGTPTFTPAAVTLMPAPTATLTATPQPAPLTEDVTYVVQRGDRLLKIAERFGVPLPCLVRVNRIANANLIYIGQQLLIPADCDSGGGDSGSGGGVSGSSARTCFLDRYPGRVAVNGLYTVRAGDTLDFIACDFNVALRCLLESNPEIAARRPRLIRAGEALNINFACPAWDGPPGPGDLPR